MKKHYLYIHYKNSDNKPFYVGIGTNSYKKKKEISRGYYRAFCKTQRSSLWNKIVSKYGYTVSIIEESDDYSYIKERESFYINQYGRIDLDTGSLCNFTNGGEGTKGTIRTPELKNKIYCYDVNGLLLNIFSKNIEILKFLNTDNIHKARNVYAACKQTGQNTAYGYIWTFGAFENRKIQDRTKLYKPVSRYSKNNELLMKYPSLSSVKEDGFNHIAVWSAVNGKTKTSGGYIWKYD